MATLLVAGLSGWLSWHEQEVRLEETLVATSRAIIQAVDGEFDQAVALGRALAASTLLNTGDLAGFDQQARRVLQHYGYTLVLSDPERDLPLVDTRRPPGSPMAPLPADWHTRVLAAPDKPAIVAPLFREPSGEWVATVQLAEETGNSDSKRVISIVVPVSNLQRILDAQRLPSAWISSLFDTTWRIAARSQHADIYVGEQAARRDNPPPHPSSEAFRSAVKEGYTIIAGRSDSERYGWNAGVGVPVSVVATTFIQPALLSAAAGLIVAAAAIGSLLFLTARLVGNVRVLAHAAGAVGGDVPLSLPRFPVDELDRLAASLREADVTLRDHRHELEARIAEATAELRRELEERRRAEAALARAQRLEAVGQLTGGIAHDFNNLLSVIIGNLELIELGATQESVRMRARAAKNGAQRGARLVAALLAFARQQPLRPDVVDVNSLLVDFAPVLKGAAGGAVDVQLVLRPALQCCRVDPAQFQSAVLNLVTNARAAMPRGGRITIETAMVEIGPQPDGELMPGGYIRVSVADTGQGMTEAVAARAFEPFFTTKSVGEGSGLGLSQVYGFCQQSGGDARLRSEPDVGTTVDLLLPATAERPVPAAVADNTVPQARRPAVVLVVDDDAEVRAALGAGVRQLGYDVAEASSGAAALARIENGAPVDLVLTDHLMPDGVTGRELAARLSSLRPGLPLLLISGNVASIPDPGSLRAQVLQKPVRLAELARALDSALARRGASNSGAPPAAET